MNDEIFQERYKKLNAAQKEAVDTIFGPVMVIAGPGTGKTTVLTLRIANILRQGSALPGEILALTFTESAVRSMREKLREIIGDTAFRVNIFTFHGFANTMRASFPEYFEKIGGRQPSSETDSVEIISGILERSSFRELRPTTFGVSIRDIVKRISDLKREAVDPETLLDLISNEEEAHHTWKKILEKINKTVEAEIERKERYFRRLREFAEVFSLYEKELEKRALYDYDDTILGLLDALRSHPDMLAEMRESFQFVLADEHQDANGSQNAILHAFKGLSGEEDEDLNLFVVGDDKQSIFAFQGASLENFYNFKKEFPKAREIILAENYRSQKAILDVAHGLISHDDRQHVELSAQASLEGRPIEVLESQTLEDELEEITRLIASEIQDEKATVAVIARTNATLEALAAFLQAKDIPFSLAAEKSLFESFEYRKLRYLFSALLDPFSDQALLRSLYMGYFKMDIADLLTIRKYAMEKRKPFGSILFSLPQDIEISDKEALEALRARIKDLVKGADKLPLLPFLKKISDSVLVSAETESYEVLRELFDEASKLIQKKRAATLRDFSAHLDLLEEHNLTPLIGEKSRKAQVELMSIHRSKGLEYDFVHIIDVTDRRFEKSGRRNDLLRIPGIGVAHELDEDRRLLYVAITRAKRHVTVSYSLTGQNGQATVPSILVDELLPSLVVKKEVAATEQRTDFLQLSGEAKEDFKDLLRQEFLERSFSVTALNNFLECPWKYVVKNLLLVPEPFEFASMLGTASHEALRLFHLKERKGEKVSLSEFERIIGFEVERQPFSSSELPVALERVCENLRAYHASFKPFGQDTKVYIEESFKVPLAVGGDVSFEAILSGKIDLITESSEGIKVTDFKSRKKVSRNEILGETKTSDGNYIRQLRFYKLLWDRSRENNVSAGSIVFLSPERGKITEEIFELGAEDLRHIEKETIQALTDIYELHFWDRRCDQKDCEYCAWADALQKTK